MKTLRHILLLWLFIQTPLEAKEYLFGTVVEPTSTQQYQFNQDTLTNSCNKLKRKYGNDKVTLSTGSDKAYYNRRDNECIVKQYSGRSVRYQNTRFGVSNSILNK